jgi:hypothetical protein
VIEINYTLHTDDGDILHEERHSPLVPYLGELVTLDDSQSFRS